MNIIYVCSKCGESSHLHNLDDWLVASIPGATHGEMVVRCPAHITEYAIRKAGGHIETRDGIRYGVVGMWEYEIS